MDFSAIIDYLTWDNIWNLIGYLASVIVLISFVMTSVVKLRWVSAIGSGLFSIYGFVIGSIPTGLLNAAVVVVNITYLVRMKKQQDLFSAHPIAIDNEFLNCFVLFHGKDIQTCFGPFDLHATDADTAILVYCNMTCAGLLVGKNLGGGKLRIDLDYATPEYRDCRVGKFLYRRLSELGFHTLQAPATSNERHVAYLSSMGFQKVDNGYEKNV